MIKSLTKASIVQRLLDKKQITAEEAVVLLEEASSNHTKYPYTYPYAATDRKDTVRCSTSSTWYIENKSDS